MLNTGRITRASVVVASFIATAWLYPRLPDRIAVHWGLSGQADGFADKPWAPFIMPLVLLGFTLLMELAPRLSPRSHSLVRSGVAYGATFTATCILLGLAQAFILAVALGYSVSVQTAIPIAVGSFLMVVGNYLSKTSKNFFMGIRTPWTLANDEVWFRTHRLGGRIWVVAGAALIVTALLGHGMLGLLLAVFVCVLVPTIYSYVVYRQLDRLDV